MAVEINRSVATFLIEGAKIKLRCRLEDPPDSKKKKDPKPLDAKWTIECDHFSGDKTIPFKVTVGGDAVEHTIHTEKLPDDSKAYYGFKYKLEVDGKLYDQGQYAIFPERLHLTAKYKHKGSGSRPKRLKDGEDKEYADGDTVDGLPFCVKQETWQSELLHTTADGTREIPLNKAAVARVIVEPPWELTEPSEESLYDLHRNRVIEVHRKPFTAEIFSQGGLGKSEDDPARHYVNMPSDPMQDQGEVAQIRVRAKEDAGVTNPSARLAQFGDTIFFKVTFAANNSKRWTPKPRVIVDGKKIEPTDDTINPGDGERIFEGKLEVSRRGDVFFDIGLGLSGGDMCKVQVGTTDACSDDTTWIQTWRKLVYEIDQPQHTGAKKVTDNTWVGETGFPADTKDHMDEAFGEAFVEVTCEKQRFYETTDLIGNGAHNMVDFSHFESTGAGKVVVLSHGDAVDQIMKRKAELSANPRAFSIVVVDYLLDMIPLNYVDLFDGERSFNAGVKAVPIVTEDCNGMSRGDYPIRRLTWRASHYFSLTDGDWKEITRDTHPGGIYRALHELTDPDEIKQMIGYDGWRLFKIMFPVGAKFPGAMRTGAGKLRHNNRDIMIEVEIEGCGGDSYLGSALGGEAVMCTRGTTCDPVGFANTIIHEMGHNMGMTWLSKDEIANVADRSWGRKPANDIPGLDVPEEVPTGVYYAEHGHTGTHCATGVGDKTLADFGGAGGTCLMFGEGSMTSSTKIYFCDDCKLNLKAEDLRDVRKKW
jgi:hypothetical protein